MASVEDRLDKLEEDMYFGRGKENPPVTVRLDRLEEVMSTLKTVKWLLVASIISAVFNIASSHFKLF